jgi:predicted DNA-binding transcriptional regulator AlpA
MPANFVSHLSIKKVQLRTGLSSSDIYDLMAKNKFPKRAHNGRSWGWSEDDIQDWLLSRFKQNKGK